ncbi:hypothetical protein FIBSPDRAFT_146283 [Athelia psychrophila]|uniref:Uncharacterized protein n=1 Tax=Athelia psychrophila TaxID=1759441 RepID=A0A166T4X8_9AGAM|nr:hypothetical protein FIBSPDRAFT_146283 [Fibularhizoctonia sp. CBS 109695]
MPLDWPLHFIIFFPRTYMSIRQHPTPPCGMWRRRPRLFGIIIPSAFVPPRLPVTHASGCLKEEEGTASSRALGSPEADGHEPTFHPVPPHQSVALSSTYHSLVMDISLVFAASPSMSYQNSIHPPIKLKGEHDAIKHVVPPNCDRLWKAQRDRRRKGTRSSPMVTAMMLAEFAQSLPTSLDMAKTFIFLRVSRGI